MSPYMHPFWLIVLSAVLALVPIFMSLITSYLKISIVLGILRSGLGTQQVPSSGVIMAVSVALTFYIMAPVFQKTGASLKDIDPNVFKEIPKIETIGQYEKLLLPWKEFMASHAGGREKLFFVDLAKPKTDSSDAVISVDADQIEADSLRIIVPAFVFSELKQAFVMSFVVLLPFLVIDLIVANLLIGMGMYMVSPVMISLPVKLILFVWSDAWILLAKGLVNSYGGGG